MTSDSEQSAAPSTIDGYFHKAPSIGSVPAKRTRNFDTKRPPVPPKPKKNLSKPTQESAMKPPPSKRKKLKDSQFTRHVTTSIENPSDDFDETSDDNSSNSDTEFLTAIDDSGSSQSRPSSQSPKPTSYQRPLTSCYPRAFYRHLRSYIRVKALQVQLLLRNICTWLWNNHF